VPTCPRCRDEYAPTHTTCAECGIALLPDGAPLPPQVDALLGTFDPRAAVPVVRLLEHRGVAHDALHLPPADADDDPTDVATRAVEVVVDREFRDDLRAELIVNWGALLRTLEPDDLVGVLQRGGQQPGWLDPPAGAWVDGQGRLQVARTEAEEREEDANRVVGPVLATLGGVLLLFGWWSGQSDIAVVLGGLALVVGVFLPR
jgi:hypothetical protein